MSRRLKKEAFYDHPPEDVWLALTEPEALAEWLMPNNFQPVVGRVFRFHVDPMPGFSGITECQVLEVDPPRRLVYSWTPLPKNETDARPAPMTIEWSLEPMRGGTMLRLEQSGIESLNLWHRFSMSVGWNRMMRSHLRKVLQNVRDGSFSRGALKRRDFGTRTVPPGFSK